jgi:hypothetical protein
MNFGDNVSMGALITFIALVVGKIYQFLRRRIHREKT